MRRQQRQRIYYYPRATYKPVGNYSRHPVNKEFNQSAAPETFFQVGSELSTATDLVRD